MMQIGSVTFNFTGTCNPIPFLRNQKSNRSFLEPVTNTRSDVTVDVDIQPGSEPNTDAMVNLFEEDRAWIIFKDKNGYCFQYHPPVSDTPLWSAFFSPPFSNVSVLVHRQPVDSVFFPYLLSLLRTVLMCVLSRRKGIILHGSGIVSNRTGFLFSGQSGQGKSTLTQRVANRNDFKALSDERMVIQEKENRFIMYGTPWQSNAEIAVNESAPLLALCFIHHGTENRIEPITTEKALTRLLPVATIPWYDADLMTPLLDVCDKLLSTTPSFDFWFKPDQHLPDFIQTFTKEWGNGH